MASENRPVLVLERRTNRERETCTFVTILDCGSCTDSISFLSVNSESDLGSTLFKHFNMLKLKAKSIKDENQQLMEHNYKH